jgi:hypothetical protein
MQIPEDPELCIHFKHAGYAKVGTQSDIRDQRYRNVRYGTEVRRVRHYIGNRNKLLSDISYPTPTFVNHRSAVLRHQILAIKVVSSKPVGENIIARNLVGSFGVVYKFYISEYPILI